jgi:hypothetical protein
MDSKRLLTLHTLNMIRSLADRLTLQDAVDDGDCTYEGLTVSEAYMAGFKDGKTELANDILEAQDLINYN